MKYEDRRFIDNYFSYYRQLLYQDKFLDKFIKFANICKRVRDSGNKLIFAGNGASASISSHASTDFTQHAKVRSICFNDHNLITAFSNDYGYENWVARALDAYADPGDVVILISSSGRSPNIVSAAEFALENNLELVTFSGFAEDNPLRNLGMLSFWVDSNLYNIVESIHLIWVLSVANMLEQGAEGETEFLKDYFTQHERFLSCDEAHSSLVAFRDICLEASDRGGKVIFAGNGGSASIASHAATDFTKQSRIRSVCFNDHNLISAFSNDYGQEHWIGQCLEHYADQNDAVVLISSSGRSENMVNAAIVARKKALPVVTFTGFDANNPLRGFGAVNIWADNCIYNITEALHSVWIFCVADMLAEGKNSREMVSNASNKTIESTVCL